MRIGIVGMGTIGQAIYEKWRGQGIVLTGRGAKRIVHDGLVVAGNKELVAAADLIVIAVKPQDWQLLAAELGSLHGKLLVSVMAGVTLDQLERTGAKAVRVMPNIAITTSDGACAAIFGKGWSAEDRSAAASLFEQLGTLMIVDDEKCIDVFIGISGSGIAYLLATARPLITSGDEHSFPDARRLVAATLRGAAALLEQDLAVDELLTRIASKGGTTEEGLRVLEEHGVENALRVVVDATIKKAQAMRGSS